MTGREASRTSYQEILSRHFEFIQWTWLDNPNFLEFLLLSGLNTRTTP